VGHRQRIENPANPINPKNHGSDKKNHCAPAALAMAAYTGLVANARAV